jgi:hypothetical protein
MPETTLKQKLAELRAHIAGLGLKKSGWNEYSKYAFYELGDFLPQTLIKMAELELIGLTNFTRDDYIELAISDTKSDAPSINFYIEKTTADIQGAQRIQNIGGEHHFFRRYLWMDALELSETDVIDTTAGQKTTTGQGRTEPAYLTKEQVDVIIALPGIAEIESALKKHLDSGLRITKDMLKLVNDRKFTIKSGKKIKYVSNVQMTQLLEIQDIAQLKEKKDNIQNQGFQFAKDQVKKLTDNLNNLTAAAGETTEELDIKLIS